MTEEPVISSEVERSLGTSPPISTRFAMGPRGVKSPVTSMPLARRICFARGRQREPRQGPMPRREMCLSSCAVMLLRPSSSFSRLSSDTSSQWHTYVAAPSVVQGVSCSGSGYLSTGMNPRASVSPAAPIHDTAFTTAIFVLLGLRIIRSISPVPSLAPLSSTRNTSFAAGSSNSYGKYMRPRAGL